MVTGTAALAQAGPADGAAGPTPRPGSIAYWLSGALALSAAASSLLTFLIPDVLHGPAVMNGSARGTALVVLLAGVPVLGCSLLLAWCGSARATVTWLGSAAFLLYNSLMFVFATPANRLFPLYLAMLSLSVWSIGTLAWQADVRALAMRFSRRVPVRGIAVYVWVVVALNSAGWLTRIGPAVAHGGAPAYLRGTGLMTNVVYVQDLAWWLPLMAVAAAWLWRRQPRGYLIVGAGLVMWVIESISIAVDQWYAHAADPASAVASAALAPAFAVIALIGLVPIYYLLRDFGHGQPASMPGFTVPFADRRAWPAWMLAIVAAIVGAGAVLGGAQLLGNGYGMPLSWLGHTPLTTWLLPGLALLIGVAVPQLTVLALVTVASKWALFAGYLAGVALVAWIAVQLLVLQRYFFLQPVIACLGVLQVALARAWQRKTSGRPPRRTDPVGQASG
jgi:hypothetical protein